MPNLWDTENDLLAAFERLQEAETAEQSDAALAVYEESVTGALEKRDRMAGFIRTVDARVEYLKAEEGRLRERRKALENGRERLMGYIKSVMAALGMKKAEGNTSTFTLCDSPPSLVVDDEKSVPERFWVTPPPPAKVIDKAALKAALLAGEVVDGARIERGQHVRMR